MTPLDVLNLVRKLIGLALDILPAPVVRQLLDEEAIKRANAVADAAEALKFPSSDDDQ